MTIQKATNITWHQGALDKKDREKLLDQKGVVVWFTGLSSSGKSTVESTSLNILQPPKHENSDNCRFPIL